MMTQQAQPMQWVMVPAGSIPGMPMPYMTMPPQGCPPSEMPLTTTPAAAEPPTAPQPPACPLSEAELVRLRSDYSKAQFERLKGLQKMHTICKEIQHNSHVTLLGSAQKGYRRASESKHSSSHGTEEGSDGLDARGVIRQVSTASMMPTLQALDVVSDSAMRSARSIESLKGQLQQEQNERNRTLLEVKSFVIDRMTEAKESQEATRADIAKIIDLQTEQTKIHEGVVQGKAANEATFQTIIANQDKLSTTHEEQFKKLADQQTRHEQQLAEMAISAKQHHTAIEAKFQTMLDTVAAKLLGSYEEQCKKLADQQTRHEQQLAEMALSAQQQRDKDEAKFQTVIANQAKLLTSYEEQFRKLADQQTRHEQQLAEMMLSAQQQRDKDEAKFQTVIANQERLLAQYEEQCKTLADQQSRHEQQLAEMAVSAQEERTATQANFQTIMANQEEHLEEMRRLRAGLAMQSHCEQLRVELEVARTSEAMNIEQRQVLEEDKTKLMDEVARLRQREAELLGEIELHEKAEADRIEREREALVTAEKEAAAAVHVEPPAGRKKQPPNAEPRRRCGAAGLVLLIGTILAATGAVAMRRKPVFHASPKETRGLRGGH